MVYCVAGLDVTFLNDLVLNMSKAVGSRQRDLDGGDGERRESETGKEADGDPHSPPGIFYRPNFFSRENPPQSTVFAFCSRILQSP